MGHTRNIALLVGLCFHFAAAQGIKPMNTPSCSLDEKRLEERKTKVFRVLRDKASEVKSTEDGYVFSVPRSSENLDLAATVMSLETECCPLFSFSLDAKGGTAAFYIWHIGLDREEGFLKRNLRAERIKCRTRQRLQARAVPSTKQPRGGAVSTTGSGFTLECSVKRSF